MMRENEPNKYGMLVVELYNF